MSLRELYLARYASNNRSQKPKKSKSSGRHSTTSVVVSGTAFPDRVIADAKVEVMENILEPEDVPIAVHSKEFKGFKRIDNGQLAVQVNEEKAADAPVNIQLNQNTIYRDSSGRIVDINEKREQHAKTQQDNAESKARSQIALTESEQIAQAKETKLKPRDVQVDDPLLVFKPESIHKEIELYQIYQLGLQPANRFGIKAGFFWDGVDRSNGFEELLSRKRNEAKFTRKDRAINEVYDLNDDSEWFCGHK